MKLLPYHEAWLREQKRPALARPLLVLCYMLGMLAAVVWSLLAEVPTGVGNLLTFATLLYIGVCLAGTLMLGAIFAPLMSADVEDKKKVIAGVLRGAWPLSWIGTVIGFAIHAGIAYWGGWWILVALLLVLDQLLGRFLDLMLRSACRNELSKMSRSALGVEWEVEVER